MIRYYIKARKKRKFLSKIIIIFREWVSRASKKYETYSLINDLYEKYEAHLQQNKMKENELSKSIIMNDSKRKFSARKQSGSFIQNHEENENEFYLKKEIIDLIGITKYQNSNNKYIFDLSKYNKIVKKPNPQFITFGLLDIDPKINIKSYQNFNYSKLYSRYLQVMN